MIPFGWGVVVGVVVTLLILWLMDDKRGRK